MYKKQRDTFKTIRSDEGGACNSYKVPGKKHEDSTKLSPPTLFSSLEDFELCQLPPGAYDLKDFTYIPEHILISNIQNKVEFVDLWRKSNKHHFIIILILTQLSKIFLVLLLISYQKITKTEARIEFRSHQLIEII